MRTKLKKWFNLLLFMVKPKDSSPGHVEHDQNEEMPPTVKPRWVGMVKVFLFFAVAVAVCWLLVRIFS